MTIISNVLDSDEFGSNPRGALNEKCQRGGAILSFVETDNGECGDPKR
jgi:hypothetical protein